MRRALTALLALTQLAAVAWAFQGIPTVGLPDQLLREGTARSAFESDIFTYVEIQDAESEIFWVAAPRFDVAVGDRIQVIAAAKYEDLYSKRLDRTFPLIYWASALRVNDRTIRFGPHGMDNQRTIDKVREERQQMTGRAENAPEKGSIAVPEGGYSVVSLFEQQDALSGKQVRVRGKVVKVLQAKGPVPWLRLMDGTSAAAGDSVFVTSKTPVSENSIVLVTGTLVTGVGETMGLPDLLLIRADSVGLESSRRD